MWMDDFGCIYYPSVCSCCCFASTGWEHKALVAGSFCHVANAEWVLVGFVGAVLPCHFANIEWELVALVAALSFYCM